MLKYIASKIKWPMCLLTIGMHTMTAKYADTLVTRVMGFRGSAPLGKPEAIVFKDIKGSFFSMRGCDYSLTVVEVREGKVYSIQAFMPGDKSLYLEGEYVIEIMSCPAEFVVGDKVLVEKIGNHIMP